MRRTLQPKALISVLAMHKGSPERVAALLDLASLEMRIAVGRPEANREQSVGE